MDMNSLPKTPSGTRYCCVSGRRLESCSVPSSEVVSNFSIRGAVWTSGGTPDWKQRCPGMGVGSPKTPIHGPPSRAQWKGITGYQLALLGLPLQQRRCSPSQWLWQRPKAPAVQGMEIIFLTAPD